MNSNDDAESGSTGPYRWFAHPLATLVFLIATTLIFTLLFGPYFALTVFGGAISFVTACFRAYDTTD